MKHVKSAALLLAGASVLAFPSFAGAQSASDIVVTGSRVIRNGNNSPTPTTVVQADELMALQPTTITDALNNLPVFQGSRTQTSAPNTTGTYGGGNPASNQLNLRNLGPARTLVLWDGQRQPPGNYIGVVDVDIIPQMLIQRVDVVTGGASAVYGSDAIAGVVNYVTDKNFNGVKAEASYGISSRNDDEAWKAGIAGGRKLGDRGHIEASFQHYDNAGIPAKSDRDYYRNNLVGSTPGSTAAQGSAANPYGAITNSTDPRNSFGGVINNGALRGQQFASNGALSTFVHGLPTGSTNAEIGGDGGYGGEESLKATLKFDQVFTRFDYDLTDTVHLHVQAAGMKKESATASNSASYNNYVFSTQNAFLPASVRTAMGSATTFTFGKRWNQFPSGGTQTSEVKGWTLNAGLDGTLGKYNWGVDAGYGRTVLFDVFYNNMDFQKLSAALDAVVNPANGQIVCNASLTQSYYADCVPVNWFGPTAASQAAFDYVTATTHFKPWFNQAEFNAHIGGDIFNTWAGPVAAALSAEWRKQTFGNSSDAFPSQLQNCTGLRFNCNVTAIRWLNTFLDTQPASQTVTEGAVEFDVPLLKDAFLAKSMNVNAAARFTSYDYGGDTWTWKLGLDWHVNDDVTVRATRSRDIEAPSLYALFLPGLGSLQGVQDRLTGTNPSIKNTNLGNPDLVSEIGNTSTAGIVWRPTFVPGFSASLDGYYIEVTGAMINLQGFNAQLQDICYASKGTSFFCTLQDRPLGNYTNTSTANTVTAWYAKWANASQLKTYGADVEVNYVGQLADHRYTVRLFTTWQPHYLLQQPGAPVSDFGNVAYPNVTPLQAMPGIRSVLSANFGITDKIFVGVTERYRSGLKATGLKTDVYLPKDQRVKSLAQTDFNITYRLKPGNEVFANIRNAFDTMPPNAPGNSRNPGYPATDDGTGRYATVGLRARF